MHVPIVRQALPFSEPFSHEWPMFCFFDRNQGICGGQIVDTTSLIVRRGGTLKTSATTLDGGSSVLKNVAVLGGMTLNGGSLLLSGTTIIENSSGTGPGAITLNGLHAYSSGRITLSKSSI